MPRSMVPTLMAIHQSTLLTRGLRAVASTSLAPRDCWLGKNCDGFTIYTSGTKFTVKWCTRTSFVKAQGNILHSLEQTLF